MRSYLSAREEVFETRYSTVASREMVPRDKCHSLAVLIFFPRAFALFDNGRVHKTRCDLKGGESLSRAMTFHSLCTLCVAAFADCILQHNQFDCYMMVRRFINACGECTQCCGVLSNAHFCLLFSGE